MPDTVTAVATKECVTCTQPFTRSPNDSATQWERRRYCSIKCSNTAKKRARTDHHIGPRAPRLPDDTWQQRAICRGSAHRGADLWFSDDKAQRATARAVCRERCPVRAECLRWAIATKQAFGVWGGIGEDELAELIAKAN